MSDRLQEFQTLAPVLNALRPDPGARMFYELMSDALMWSDELPALDEWDRLGVRRDCLRGVFRYRTTLMLGKPEEKRRASWELLQSLCPNWPGFLADRRASDPTRIRYYAEASAKLIADWEELDAKYERQRAQKTDQPGIAV